MKQLIETILSQTDIYQKALRRGLDISFYLETQFGGDVFYVVFQDTEKGRKVKRAFSRIAYMTMFEPVFMIRYVLRNMYEEVTEEPYE